MKTVAIVQARMGSSRLPGKVMRKICETPLIELLLGRLAASKGIDQIVLATSTDQENQPLVDHVLSLGYAVFRGSETNVLERYYKAALQFEADVIVRITGDCPLVDAELVDKVLGAFEAQGVDYMTNTRPPTYPDGLDTAVFSFATLKSCYLNATSDFEKEHVVPYIRESGKFSIGNVRNANNLSSMRWTVDEVSDFNVITNIFEHFHPQRNFRWLDVIALQKEQPQLFLENQHLSRNEGSTMGSGQKLWRRAKQIIPGGNMLLSKRAEMFLPENWPAYFSRAQGCNVWDLDDRKYVDMSIMGIGTNILGYGHPVVDQAVQETVNMGNMSTLNCPEEVYLAEKLIAMHPWADMARFARTGGEANSIAIRIARAASGKDKVAICGYHGWHDWYLAANLGDDEKLAGHLLPGLEPKGVPKILQGTVLPFRYNHFEELQQIVNDTPDLGVIKMEVQRNDPPKDGFLEKVRKLATEKGIVLVFDECTSGFRETFGGLHKKYGVDPDLALFGKALGNGYAITAIIGRRAVMEAAQSTFISSTFWTERIGPTAALATLEVMESQKSWEKINQIGNEIAALWKELATAYALPMRVFGLPALIKFAFDSPNALAYKTLITQEMLAKGYLAGNSVYVCTEHSPEVIASYGEALAPILKLIAECEDGREVMPLLKGPLCHSEFKRLN